MCNASTVFNLWVMLVMFLNSESKRKDILVLSARGKGVAVVVKANPGDPKRLVS